MALLKQLGISKNRWLSTNVKPAQQINQASGYLYGADVATVSSLLGTGRRAAKSRDIIYQKWAEMEGNPIVSTALMLLVTASLGGHETTGDTIFIEKTAEAEKDKKLGNFVDEIKDTLSDLLNEVAYTIAYTGASFGDAYARIYANATGVIGLYTEEMVRPPLVQPYERGGITMGYGVYVGPRNFERLDNTQLARMKMPRIQYIPQNGVIEKVLRVAITEDDVEKLPMMPAMAGGSLLYNAEEAYDNLSQSLLGLVGQRWMDSIDEQILTVNMESMTDDQQKKFTGSLKKMLLKSKALAEDAVKNGKPVLGRIRHIFPVFNEKQLTNLASPVGTGRTAPITIDDVLFHAKLLSGSLGVDLSMIGFADMMSGGLGEGGFFRTSAQAAERSRIIRGALEGFCNHVIDIHTLKRYGIVFPEKNRPWKINFYGSISALENERQTTRANAMNSGLLLVQAIQSFKETGATIEMMENFLSKELLLDEEQAKLYAKIVEQKTEEEEGGGFGGGGQDKGGF